VAVVRRSSSVLTDLSSGRFARPVAADEFGSRAVETVFGLASPSEIRIHPARGLRGPRVARRASRAAERFAGEGREARHQVAVRRRGSGRPDSRDWRQRETTAEFERRKSLEGSRSEAQVEKASERRKAR
jgi:hypothetical protein